MTKQNVAVELYYDGAWNSLTSAGEVFTEPIVIARGQGDESQAPRPSLVSLQLDNRTGKYRPSNPQSPLYGKAGRNTPLRVRRSSTTRAVVEASAWQTDQTQDFRASPPRGKAWVDIQAGGLLQRINQWTEPLRSPMTRRVLSYGSPLVGFWPFEEERDSTALYQAVPGGSTGAWTGETTELGVAESPAGALRSIKIGDDTALSGSFRASANSGWQVSFAAKMPAVTSVYTALFSFNDSLGRTWAWEANDINYHVIVTDQSGATLSEAFSGYGNVGPEVWTLYRIKCTATDFQYAWYPETSSTPVGASHAYVAAPGALRSWRVVSNLLTTGGWFAGVFGVDDLSVDLLATTNVGWFNGYRGETAGARFLRLVGELGLSGGIIGTASESTPMGPQPAATFPELLREIAATEDGLIFDDDDQIALLFLLRRARYRQTPALTLTPTDLPWLPKEVADDQGTHNIVTVSNRGGGEATAQDSTGRLGSQPPPDGVGDYRQTIAVNVDERQVELAQWANWWLRRGTVDLPRFPQLAIDLNAKPSLITAVESVGVGSVIEIIGFRENTIRLYVLGWVETFENNDRSITLTCAADQQFYVGQWDAADSRWDLKSCELNGDHNPTTTSLSLVQAADEQWSTTSVPYDLFISGERVTVTAMGARTGTGPWFQTATVTRSVNGVVKTLLDGSPASLAQPGRWAL